MADLTDAGGADERPRRRPPDPGVWSRPVIAAKIDVPDVALPASVQLNPPKLNPQPDEAAEAADACRTE
ncbi:hypothetical protein ACFC14_02345 [Microbacterium sp. NPDC055988]|uniref:hypothetical protein n=1 Tax=Microbacterium sp. NPDC055988 TaxID=3345671 RepID=UPI0035E3B3E9